MRAKVHDRIATELPINSLVVPAIVDDPLEAGAQLRVLRNVRDDPLALMLHRKLIHGHHFEAGRRWQRYREDTEIGGGIRAINPTVEPVDGGRYKEPDISNMSTALAQLARADKVLEPYDASIVHDVLARHMTITELAATRSITSGRQISYIMDRFRGALDKLAKLWGLA